MTSACVIPSFSSVRAHGRIQTPPAPSQSLFDLAESPVYVQKVSVMVNPSMVLVLRQPPSAPVCEHVDEKTPPLPSQAASVSPPPVLVLNSSKQILPGPDPTVQALVETLPPHDESARTAPIVTINRMRRNYH